MKIKYSWPSKQGKYTILVIQSTLIGLSSVIKAYIIFFFFFFLFQILQKLIHETCRNPANINKNLEQTNSTDKSPLIL